MNCFDKYVLNVFCCFFLCLVKGLLFIFDLLMRIFFCVLDWGVLMGYVKGGVVFFNLSLGMCGFKFKLKGIIFFFIWFIKVF